LLNSITYAQDKFVAVGDSGVILTSEDNFKELTVKNLQKVLFNLIVNENNVFVSVYDNGTAVKKSTDYGANFEDMSVDISIFQFFNYKKNTYNSNNHIIGMLF
jgi:ABC-type uncharacterized transport system substrate-binding protein